MTRSLVHCMNCGEERELAGHGLCYKCYRQEERREEAAPWTSADRYNRNLLRAQKKLRKAVTTILNALDDAIDLLEPADVTLIRRTLKPYADAMARGLDPIREGGERISGQSARKDAVLAWHVAEGGGNVNSELVPASDRSKGDQDVAGKQTQQIVCEQGTASERSPTDRISDGDSEVDPR